ncbi:MAG: invasion associated locus B family protein [Alphaproteobacteria bacterium]|nr:invasion associated locus B family protein [Alphaproteobacteria bacterium]
MTRRAHPIRVPVLALAALALASGAAAAQQSRSARPAPAAKEERYDDWRVRCEAPKPDARPICFIEQRLSRKEDTDRLALAIALGFFANDGKAGMILKLPPTAVREAGIIMQVDEKPVREAGIRACGPESCTVVALVDDAMMTELRSGRQATVAYSLKDVAEVVRVPVSLRGVGKGLAALRKRQ